MKIIINNAEEAGMPVEMIGHCEQLLARYIRNHYPSLPEQGQDIAILYSETDPFYENEEADESAYFLYFSVAEIDCPDEATHESGIVYVEIAY